jgi:hypothetical protein
MLERVLAGRQDRRGVLRAAVLMPILLGMMGCASDGETAATHPPATLAGVPARGSNPLA